jgi:hypothetical protein
LIGGFWCDLFFPSGIEASFGEVISQTECPVFGNLCEGFAQLFISEVLSFFEKVGKVLEYSLGGFYISWIAINRYVLSTRINSNIQERFEIFDVLIVNTKQRFQTTRRKFNLLQMLLTFSFRQRAKLGVEFREIRR